MSRRIEIDTRSLAAFRIGLAAVLLADLLLRFRDVTEFYTDAGVLPRSALTDVSPLAAAASFHAVSGATWYQALLFLIGGALGIALFVGYRARFAAFVSALLLVSLRLRNPFVTNAGDTVLWNLLFLAALLPVGARWSVDTLRSDGGPQRVANASSLLLLSYPVLIYTTNAAFKLRGETWLAGDALATVFSLDRLTRPPAVLLAGFPTLLTAITWTWLVLVTVSALLLLTAGWIRLALLVAFAGGHLAMLFTLRIGLFPLVSIVALLPFLPGVFWTALGRALAHQRLPEVVQVLREGRTNNSAGVHRGRPVLQLLVVGVLITNVWWQAAAVGVVETPEPVAETTDPAEHTWAMFSPDPPASNHWVEVPATTANGTIVNGFHPASVSPDRPPDESKAYPNTRWRKYIESTRVADDPRRLAQYADYLCDRAGAHYRVPITSLRIIFVVERPAQPTDERQTLIDHDCSVRGSTLDVSSGQS